MKTMGILIAALALAACATEVTTTADGAPANRDCFRAESVSGYNFIDDHHVQLSVGAGRRYMLQTDWNASDLDWTHAIAIRSPNGFICTGRGLGVEIIGGDPQRTYWVNGITRAPDDNPGAAGS